MSYWCNKRLIITATRLGERLEFELDTPYARIGSHARADVRLPDLPRQALYLHATSTGVFALPTVSASELPSLPLGWLDEETPLVCGDWKLDIGFADMGPMLSAVEQLTDELPPGRMAPVFAVGHKGEIVARHRQKMPLIRIGRAHPSDLRLRTATVSTCHCVAYWDGRYVWIVDLCSTNGTRKDGQRFHAARLRRGRRISLGQVELIFETIDEIPSRPSSKDSPSSLLVAREEPAAVPDSDAPQLAPSGEDSPRFVAVFDSQCERLAGWESRLLATERDLVRRLAGHERQTAGLAEKARKATLASGLLLDQLAALQSESSRLAQWNVELEQQMLELDRRQEELDEFFASLASQQEQLKSAEALVRQQTEQLDERQLQHQAELQQREAALQRLGDELNQREAALQELQSELEQRDRQLQARQSELEGFAEQLDQRQRALDELREQVDTEQRQRTEELQRRRSELDERQTGLQERERELQGREAEIEERAEQLERQRQAWEERCRELDDEHRRRETELQQRRSELEQLDSDLRQRQEQLQRRQSEIDQRAEDVDRKLCELRQLQEEVNEARALAAGKPNGDKVRHEQLVKDLQATIAGQRKELTERDDALKQVQVELDELRVRFESERESWMVEKEKCLAQLATEREQLEAEKQTLQARRAELESLKEQWERDRQRRSREEESEREAAFNELKKARKELEKERLRLQAERSRLEALAIEQAEELAAAAQASDSAARRDADAASGGHSLRNDDVSSNDNGASGEEDEPRIDPRKMLENDPAFDELTERLVEFNRKRRRRWLW